MQLIQIYECFCDETRLRLLHLLSHAPLCVCHFQEVLGVPQVKVSKHLKYLKRHGLVESEKCGNWRVYRLPQKRSAELTKQLKCLQDCVQEQPVFKADLKRLQRIAGPAKQIAEACCHVPAK
jgi:ArsR family transcriptional regulator, arsenate/arsenite/antimonite-responsive transcriptional repressor